VKPTHKEVILAATEFDAMAVHQDTGLLAVALPKGDTVLPQKVIVDVKLYSVYLLYTIEIICLF